MNVRRIGPAEFEKLRELHPEVALIDVREPNELVVSGSIPGVTNIPVRSLGERMNELPSDKQQPVVLICQSGGRSLAAAAEVARHGYTNVHSLDGGTVAWQRLKGQ